MNNDLLMISAFPPPVGGAAKNSLRISNDLLKEGAVIIRINTSGNGLAHAKNANYHVNRITTLIKNTIILLHSFAKKQRRMYIVPDGGLGVIYSTWYLLLGSLFAKEIFIHFRNFSYIDKKSPVLDMILKLTESKSTYIFLDEYMQERMIEGYASIKSNKRHQICYNSGSIDFEFDIENSSEIFNKKVNIGYLSNLCKDKGFDDIFDLITKINNLSNIDNIQFHIGGTPLTKMDEEILKKIQQFSNVKYYGQVNKNKKEFYDSCDIFIFPTKFKQEAQPNVIWEALASGAYPVSYDVGSIRWMLEKTSGLISCSEKLYDDILELITETQRSNNKIDRSKIKNSTFDLIITGKKQYMNLLRTLKG